MVSVQNNFDGGTTGTTITTGNSGFNNDAFSYVNASLSGVLQYASVGANNLNRPTAEYVMAQSTGATAHAKSFVGWNSTSLGTITTFYVRFYVYFSAITTNTALDTGLMSSYLTSGFPGVQVNMATDLGAPYQLYIWNNTQSTFAQMTTGINVGEWNRIEFRATVSNGSSGTADLYLYAGANADGVIPTEHVSQSGQNYGTNTINTVTIGADYFSQTNTPTIYYSNFQVNTTGYPGPAPYRAGLGTPTGNLTNPIAIHSAVD
jgi:hypothetical protein